MNRNRLNSMGDFLSLFSEGGQPAPAQPSAPHAPTFDPNDPRIAEAMRVAREQERAARIAEQQQLKAQVEAERKARAEQDARLAALEASAQKAREEAEAAARSKMKPDERMLAELESMKSELQREREARARTVEEANKRMEAWQIQSEKDRLIAKYNGNIDPLALDTSSLESLRASEQRAVETYQATRQHFFSQFQKEQAYLQQVQQGQNQQQVEQLAGYPSGYGVPTSNNAGTPAPASASAQPPAFAHPQVDGGASYASVRDMAHGRVQMVAPPQPGQNFFQPQYPQHQQPMPVQYPQGNPTGPVNPAQYAPQQQLPQQQPQQPTTAPLPDQSLAPGQPERQLSPQEIANAKEHAAAIALSRRGSGPNTPRAQQIMLADRAAGGAQPVDPRSLPSHQGPAVGSTNHPMAAPRAGTV